MVLGVCGWLWGAGWGFSLVVDALSHGGVGAHMRILK